MQKKRNYVNAAVVVLVLAFCGVVLACAGYIVHTHSRPVVQYPQLKSEACAQSGTLNDPTGRQAALDALVTEGMLTFSINVTPSIENGSGMANLLIENPPENGNHFTVAILREDTEETLFRSGYLDPEQYIGKAPLDMELTAGMYACVTNSNAYRISDNAYIGRGVARITLCVRN